METSLKRWGFTPQKPVKRAYQRNDPQVLEQLHQECPSIKAPAKEEDPEIHWGGETGSVSIPENLKGYCPKGQTTVLKHSAKKFNINRISTVTNQGKVRLLIYDKKNGTSFDSFSEKSLFNSGSFKDSSR